MMSNHCFGYGNQLNQYSTADFMPLSTNLAGPSDGLSMYNPLSYHHRATNYYTHNNSVVYGSGMNGQINKGTLRSEPSITTLILGQAQPRVSQMSSYNSYWQGPHPVQLQPRPQGAVSQGGHQVTPCPERKVPICQQSNVSERSHGQRSVYDEGATMRQRARNEIHERAARHREREIEREIDREKRKEKQREREKAKQEERERERQKQLEKEEVRMAAERLAERAREMERQKEKEKQARERRRQRQKEKLMQAQQRQATNSATECPIWPQQNNNNNNSTTASSVEAVTQNQQQQNHHPNHQNQPWPLGPNGAENVSMNLMNRDCSALNTSLPSVQFNGTETLESQLRTCCKPVIGLGYIIEFVDPVALVRVYQCQLCSVFRTTASILEHITSYKHRIRTLVKQFPNEANLFLTPDKVRIEQNCHLISVATRRAAEYELHFGRGEVQVRHERATFPPSVELENEDSDFMDVNNEGQSVNCGKLLLIQESINKLSNIKIESNEECQLVKNLIDTLKSAICEFELVNLQTFYETTGTNYSATLANQGTLDVKFTIDQM